MKTQIYQLLSLSSLLVSISLIVNSLQDSVSAQITATPNDAGTVIKQNGNTLNIEGGTQAGKNLFHSFDKFGVNNGQTANFISTPNIKNILGKVTGGDASVINGIIQVTGGNSNLYLMNPAGIIFGSGARLNVPGSFTATTANGIELGDKWFNAFGTNNYADLVGEPNSFAFSVNQPGGIFNAGNLEVGQGDTLNLLGGTVINTGTLKSEGGNINIAAIPGKKLVKITQEGSLLSLGLPTSTENKLNPVTFTPLSLPQLLTGGNLNSATGVTVENGVIKLTGSGVEIPNDVGTTIVSGNVDVSGDMGGKANILGEKVGIVDGNINAAGKNGGGTVLIGGDYKGEGTVPNAKRTVINRDSVVKADAEDTGNGGKVIAWADETTVFQGTISARGGKNSGDGGFVEVSGKENLAFDGFVDVGADSGKGGELLLDPKIVEIVENGDNDSQLNDQEILKDDEPDDTFKISASKIVDALDKGDLTIEATENINITSNIDYSGTNSGSNAFNLTLTAPDIDINSREINVRGNLNLQATNIKITESNVRAQGNIKIQGDKGISITAPNNILQSGGDFSLISNEKITANARISSGGNFSADSGTFSQSEEFNLKGIISSNGDVTFGNYTGSSLKVEAKGNIQGGNITINEAGAFPQKTGDSDINILNAGPAVILRAGVTELKHNPQSGNLEGTGFTSTTNPSSQGSIEVGNINAGSSVILSAKGDIVTGSIETKGPFRFEPVIADSVNLTSSNGKIIVDYISVDDSNQSIDIDLQQNDNSNEEIDANLTQNDDDFPGSFLGDISINSFGVFQAIGTKELDTNLRSLAKDGNESFTTFRPKASIVAPGKISIKHGGKDFKYALGLKQDNGQLIFEINDSPVSINESEVLVFEKNKEEVPLNNGSVITTSDVSYDIENLPENNSFTVGGIFLEGGPNAVPQGSYQDTPLNFGSTKKVEVSQVIQTPKPETPTPKPETPTENKETEAKTAQRQLNQNEKNNICSPENSNVALNSEDSNRDVSSKNNPCKTTNDKDTILKVIPDNRFSSNSALTTSLFKLGEK